MRYFEKGTTKVEIINEILTLEPSLKNKQCKLFSKTIDELIEIKKEIGDVKND